MEFPGREEVERVPFYCEENIYRLFSDGGFAGARAWAVLIANRAHDVVFMRQRAGREVDGLVHWDYHVVALLESRPEGFLVLDPDSDLSFPCPAERYLEESFPLGIETRGLPRFRLVDSREYVSSLVSDRSHMRRQDGSWRAPPPPWPWPGEGREDPPNLLSWLDMGRREPGKILDLRAFRIFIREHHP